MQYSARVMTLKNILLRRGFDGVEMGLYWILFWADDFNNHVIRICLLGIKTLKSIWDKHLVEYFNELLEWNKRSFFFLYGLFGIGYIKY
ncbi:hypothetical protein RCG24_15420 [Neobacillus sp. OS1-32]|jgi:hypothetical protein|uniref:Uncharacterized protein n=1 Tax=Neobacillus paridis TaxID=2803862 RepID=A0ABS1TUX0_9BACI|nr:MULTISPECIES: hypothetical protein [Neobacillus]MBL4954373.1 hypothetical protein [Neobacillus paridis]WML29346.1 hypothetical protein RCG24_15420 [Neobacillus sp. OS1-32]